MNVIDPNASLSPTVAWLAGCTTLPADVDAKARLLLLDTFGCVLAGLRHPEVTAFGRALRLAFPGHGGWPTCDSALAPAGLAALGAAGACWDEACEGNSAAHGRPGLPIVPTVLALATQGEVSLGELLLALVSGYEIGARAGELWRIPPGWHVDGSWHSLGVAAAAARLSAGPQCMQGAIEAAACQIPASLYLPIAVGSVARNTYPSHAVLLGIMAAAAADAGFAMPAGALQEGRRRVLRASDDGQATPAGQWTILDGYLKPFAGVRHTHYGVEAALRLRQRAGFAADRIGGITLRTYAEATQYCGIRAPHTAIQAQFSLSYAIAAALALGDLGPEAYADLSHPQIARLEQMVVVEVDPARTQRGAELTIDVGGQRSTEAVNGVAGDPASPMTQDDVVAKFHRYVDMSLGRDGAQTLVRFCLEGKASDPIGARFTFTR